ncbi:MAG: type II toxin-antitoxin system VapC family toxin [Opitutales bacterium]
MLDTSAILFLAFGDSRLSDGARDRIANADQVCYSSVSAYEINFKHKLGKLLLPTEPESFLRTVNATYGFAVIPVSEVIANTAAALPLHHRDPFDRIIIATAAVFNTEIITSDRIFSNYAVTVHH